MQNQQQGKSRFVLLQNYARNALMRFFMGCESVADVEPGYRGSVEVFRRNGSKPNKVKISAREKSGQSLYCDPKWREDDADLLGVYLLDKHVVWFMDHRKLWRFIEANQSLLEIRHGKVVVPWTAIREHVNGKCEDLSSVPYFRFGEYKALRGCTD